MQIGDNFLENSNPVFLWKNEKSIINLSSAEFVQEW